MALKLFKPYIHADAIKNVERILKGDQIAEGQEVKDFENEFAKAFNLENVVAVNSGTSALELAYELANLQKGDEVITPVLTCTATNIPLVRRGVQIVFADIERDLNISIKDVKNKITSKTKAIVFVHFGGNYRGLEDLVHLCNERKITLIEDAAQSVGSGVFGMADFTCVSLQAIKTLTSGDGGFIITKSRTDYELARKLRWFGYDRERKHTLGDVDLTEAGYKYHMNNIAAAIGRGNLAHLDDYLAHKVRIAQIYQEAGLFTHVWLAGGILRSRMAYKELKEELKDIEIGQHHYRNDQYTIFKDFKNYCPLMDEIEGRYFFVPYHYGVSEDEARYIARIVKKYL
jgi:dTDP-4-amino-4,6-dideoxygalactose transaminase